VLFRLRAALVCGFVGGAFGWLYPLFFHQADMSVRRIFALQYTLVGITLGLTVSNYWLFRRHVIAHGRRRAAAQRGDRGDRNSA